MGSRFYLEGLFKGHSTTSVQAILDADEKNNYMFSLSHLCHSYGTCINKCFTNVFNNSCFHILFVTCCAYILVISPVIKIHVQYLQAPLL